MLFQLESFRTARDAFCGVYDELRIESGDAQPIKALIDGEQVELPRSAKFAVAPCEVDLLATDHGF